MSYATPYTFTALELVTAALMNGIQANISALWVGTAAGDMDYYSSATAKTRLAKPSVDSLLKNTSVGTPSWLALTSIGGIHAKGLATFAPGGQAFSGGWADITGATLTLTLSATCTVLVFAVVTGYNGTGGRAFFIRSVVDGTADTSTSPFNGGAARNEALPYIYYATGVTAGSRIVKLQCVSDTDPNYVERGVLIALAFVEN